MFIAISKQYNFRDVLESFFGQMTFKYRFDAPSVIVFTILRQTIIYREYCAHVRNKKKTKGSN